MSNPFQGLFYVLLFESPHAKWDSGRTISSVPVRRKEDIMPVVIVNMWPGRDIETRRRIAEGITETFTREGVPREVVHVILNEVPKDCWAEGGHLCSD